MTVQQQIAQRVLDLSDEGAELVGQLLNSLNPNFFKHCDHVMDTQDVSKRFGAGKGIIRNTELFDDVNDEIAELFGGAERTE